MIIDNNKVVALTYELEVEGSIRDKATKERPLDFIFGQGYLLPEFEANVAGKKVGDTFEFTLSPENGYGVYNPDAVIDLAKKIFEIDGQKLVIDPEVLDLIVDTSIKNKLGARGLRSICEQIMNDAMYEAPSSGKKTFHLTLDYARSKLENQL